MGWQNPYRGKRLRDYYLGFAVMIPPGLIALFAVVKLLFHMSIANLVVPWALLSALLVLGGAPLLHWAHDNSLRTGNLRPVVLAVEAMLLCGLAPVIYFLIKENGFDLWPLVGTSLVVLVPFIQLYWHPPKRARERLEEVRRKSDDSKQESP